MSNEASLPRYMPQLDGLRCMAVGAVLYRHFAPVDVQLGVNWGNLGVRLFFVLSGFLITGILLQYRPEAGVPRAGGAGTVARRFYVRRFLRIFPIYYLTLFVAAALAVPDIREGFFWYLTYLSNFYFAFDWANKGLAMHFWSLAVEEQFYLVWPWLMLFAPRRYVGRIIVGAIALGPVWRVTALAAGWNEVTIMFYTPGCMDSLGMGALFAWLIRERGVDVSAVLARKCMWAGLPLLIFVWAVDGLAWGHTLRLAIGDTAGALVFVGLVVGGAKGYGGGFGKALTWGPINYCGKISYGIYLLHPFCKHAYMVGVAPALGLSTDLEAHPVLLPLAWTVMTIALAALSWQIYEKPLNGLKRRYPYSSEPSKV